MHRGGEGKNKVGASAQDCIPYHISNTSSDGSGKSVHMHTLAIARAFAAHMQVDWR